MTFELLIQLAGIGLFVGSLPLIYATLQGSKKNFERLAWLTAFCTFDLIIFGAFTRLTDSGLGCPDWPGCYGQSNPLAAMSQILQAQEQMPFGPVTVSKAWIEMLHRYFAMGVGFLILLMTAISWLKRAQLGIQTCYASFGLLLLVCVQGAFGAWTVTLKLQPMIVTIHLLLGLLLLVGLTALTAIANRITDSEPSTIVNDKSTFPLWIPTLGFCILFAQIFLGGWVSTNYAVLACRDFPLCGGKLIPEMNFQHGFTFWRELGKTASGDFIDMQSLIAIHWIHRVGAIFALTAIFFVYKKAKSAALQYESLHHLALTRWANFLGLLGLLQLLTGLSNIVLEWPLLAALMHTAGAAALLVCMTKLIFLAVPSRS
jgi:cytochrome c oxidase assembly protein subunit 15